MKREDNEIEALKRNWERDPCWDIEETEGFEEHKEELREYRLKREAEWEKARIRHHDKLLSLMCPLSIQWINNGVDDKGFTWQNCLAEKCAWWNEPNECCAIRALNLK